MRKNRGGALAPVAPPVPTPLRIAGNIGGELNLVDCWFYDHTTKFKSANYFSTTNVTSSCDLVDPVTAKLISANLDFPPFSSNPSNLIPANISGYTIYKYSIHYGNAINTNNFIFIIFYAEQHVSSSGHHGWSKQVVCCVHIQMWDPELGRGSNYWLQCRRRLLREPSPQWSVVLQCDCLRP